MTRILIAITLLALLVGCGEKEPVPARPPLFPYATRTPERDSVARYDKMAWVYCDNMQTALDTCYCEWLISLALADSQREADSVNWIFMRVSDDIDRRELLKGEK